MALILQSMPQVQREQIVALAARQLHQISRSAIIAGGYPRDAVLGGRVKDIDIFVDSSRYPTDERRDALCDRIYEAFGQTWERTTPSPEMQATYGADPVTGEEFQTYNALTTDSEWNRVNVIFSRQNQKVNQFDWSICRFYVDSESINPIYNMSQRDRDLNNIMYVGGFDAMRNTAGLIEHANRIRAKYEGCRFVFDPNSFSNMGALYSQMIQGGLIGEQARQILPTETQVSTGDTMGLNFGEAPVGEARRGGGLIGEQLNPWAPGTARRGSWVRAAAQALRDNTPIDVTRRTTADVWDVEVTMPTTAPTTNNEALFRSITQEPTRFRPSDTWTHRRIDDRGLAVPDSWRIDPVTRRATPF